MHAYNHTYMLKNCINIPAFRRWIRTPADTYIYIHIHTYIHAYMLENRINIPAFLRWIRTPAGTNRGHIQHEKRASKPSTHLSDEM